LPPGGRLIGGEAQPVASLKANKLAWQVYFLPLTCPAAPWGRLKLKQVLSGFFGKKVRKINPEVN
jgi:hypothetical protein